VLSPVLDMVPTEATWPAGIIDGVIATSARAFELLSATPDWPLPEARRLLPLFLVGERTLAARDRGFEGPAVIAPDANSLVDLRFAALGRLVSLGHVTAIRTSKTSSLKQDILSSWWRSMRRSRRRPVDLLARRRA
jgi:hypothetical protein